MGTDTCASLTVPASFKDKKKGGRLVTACSHMCWASLHLASDQEGWARQQMARRSGMQEVSGLDAAHKDDRTYGKENMVQDMKSGLSIVSRLQETLVRLQEPFAP